MPEFDAILPFPPAEEDDLPITIVIKIDQTLIEILQHNARFVNRSDVFIEFGRDGIRRRREGGPIAMIGVFFFSDVRAVNQMQHFLFVTNLLHLRAELAKIG